MRITLLCFVLTTFVAQAQPLTSSEKKSTVERMVELINENYVFPDVGKATGELLLKNLKAGEFDSISTAKSFATVLTQTVQSVNHDKHMRVRAGSSSNFRGGSSQGGNGGFRESKILEGNVGYLDVRAFIPPQFASAAADEHMKKLENVSALIIDLRRNGGGSPDMVQYLCSYFFKERTHLNSLYFRPTNRTTEYWTVDVKGKKLPNVPLFILTSNFTFSGAEEFCYNMQTRKRATLIGETTGGGANPGDTFIINESFSIFIPTGRAINPVTGTNWEGKGVTPDVKIPSDDALEKALELVKKK